MDVFNWGHTLFMPSPPFLSKPSLRIQRYTSTFCHIPSPPPPRRRNSHEYQGPEDLLTDPIRRLSAQGRLSEAFTLFSLLLRCCGQHHRLPFLHPISSLLACTTALRACPQGEQLHAHVISVGVSNNPYLVSRLTSFYAALCRLSDARAVVESSTSCIALAWNILVSAYARGGLWCDAILTYKQMVGMGVRSDRFTYPSLLRACREMVDLDIGRGIHGRVEISGLSSDLFVRNALVALYSKCGALGVARKVFDGMPERDVFTWNSMIAGYVWEGMWEEAFGLLDSMPEGVDVDTVTWNTIIAGNLRVGKNTEALRLISQLQAGGLVMDSVTLVTGLNACSRIGSVRHGREMHAAVIRKHFDGIENVRNALITMYSRCLDIGYACFLFRNSADRSLVTWNAMIAGFALAGQSEEASLLFRDMVRTGIQPNYVTVVIMLSMSAQYRNLHQGMQLHGYITRQRFDSYISVWNSLIDMYSKSGRMQDAQRVFDMMIDHDAVTYTSLIAGYGMNGEGITSLKLFHEMIRCHIRPDHITMAAVLSACSHSGLVSQGEMMFEKMVGLFGIMPRLEHYSCMVDLYARAGLLRKAEEILSKMPFQPSAAMLATIVRACRTHRNKKIGIQAANMLLEMTSVNPRHYVLVESMYAHAGCWQELAKVRTLMKNMGIRKAHGSYCLDVGNDFQFYLRDTFNLHARQIHMLLEESNDHTINGRYVGTEESSVDEEVG